MDAVQNSLIYQSTQQAQQVHATREAGPIRGVEPVPAVDEVKKAPVYDVYVKGEKQEEPTGIYEVTVDDEGNPKVLFDDPEKAEKSDSTPPDRDAPAAGQGSQCTTNTDAVDREIKGLKTEKENLEQKIQSTVDEADRARLEQKLAALDMELTQKDSDTYRKQHATYTFS